MAVTPAEVVAAAAMKTAPAAVAAKTTAAVGGKPAATAAAKLVNIFRNEILVSELKLKTDYAFLIQKYY